MGSKIKEKIGEIVNVICRNDRSKSGFIVYEGNNFKYRLHYEGQRWFEDKKIRSDNFICNLRVEFKEKDRKLYETYCRVNIKELDNPGLTFKYMVESVYLELRNEILDMDDIIIFKDFFC